MINLLLLVHVLVALSVTMHVLLTKRDVRAAIGWIGLTWLSPVVGPLLYYVFGINRVTRRAFRLHLRAARHGTPHPTETVATDDPEFPEHIAAIARVGAQVTGRVLTPGNAVSILSGGDDAYPAMIAAIDKAQRSVALASYIFQVDRVGRAFIEALRKARARDVEIRVLVDGVGSGYLFSPAFGQLSRSGITVARFMHDWRPWRMSFLNMRSHKKLLIIDGSVGFTGGINLGAENVRALRPPRPIEDVHFRVEGPVVSQLMQTFAEDWNFTTHEVLTGDLWWPHAATRGSVFARGISSGPDEDMGKLEAVLAAAVGQAKRRLRIVTPYFLPDLRLMSGIILAALRGVEVDVVIPENSDHVLLDWAMRAHLGFFAVPGVRCHLTPPPFDHSKLVSVDGCWCSLGSANWDVRSLRLNFEFMLECYDRDFVTEIDRLIDQKIKRARSISRQELAQRPLAHQLRDAVARLLLPYL